MSDDSKNGISLSTIHELIVNQGVSLGEIRGRVGSIDDRLDSVESEMSTIRQAWQQQGIKIGEIGSTCLRHATDSAKRDEKISALYRALDKVEDTGVIHVAALEKEKAIADAKWRVLKYLGAGVVAAIGIAQTIFAIMKGV